MPVGQHAVGRPLCCANDEFAQQRAHLDDARRLRQQRVCPDVEIEAAICEAAMHDRAMTRSSRQPDRAQRRNMTNPIRRLQGDRTFGQVQQLRSLVDVPFGIVFLRFVRDTNNGTYRGVGINHVVRIILRHVCFAMLCVRTS
ncbi:hypothetical protein WI61_29290 [Burkholderia cepacia]|nr:hypothetical protein WI61_29290 [Burkholderia cepacia]